MNPLISAGLDTGLNYATGLLNRRYNEKQYAKQRADNLSDWNMQNAYNSPQQQMQRLKEAGLNPNMVYGQGATATSPQQPKTTPMQSGDIKSEAPNIGMKIQQYQNTELQKAQTDNLRAQNEVILKDAALKDAQTLATLANIGKTDADTEMSRFNLKYKATFQDTQLDQAKANLIKTVADTNFTNNQDARAASQNSMSLRESLERILKSQSDRSKTEYEKKQIAAQIKHVNTDTEIKKQDLKLKASGLQPHDALWQRALKTELDKLPSLKEIGNKIGSSFKNGVKGITDGIKNIKPQVWQRY